ncbi:hypothetical protein [Halomicronema sp. CCY15110]|nr:hypothetical protein [Halomicronema sp. CCY15110]
MWHWPSGAVEAALGLAELASNAQAAAVGRQPPLEGAAPPVREAAYWG